jgi:cytochrome b involved in lipid metabolism
LHLTVQLFTLPAKGKDATEAFEDVGHSDEARALLPGMKIGEFEKGANVSPTLPSLRPCPIFTLCQEAKAKSYQSTAAASAMESAVEQTSKFVRLLPCLTQLS